MPQQRPTNVLVMAILSLVYGSLGLVGFLCGMSSLLFLFNVDSNHPIFGEMSKMARELEASVPGYKIIAFGQLTLSLVMNILLLASAIGLLKMRPWARKGAMLYAVVAIVTALFGTVYTIAYVNPATAKWQREMHERMSQRTPGRPPPPSPQSNPVVSGIASVIGAVLPIALAVALLIVLTRPNVVAAFEGRGDLAREPFPDDDADGGAGEDGFRPGRPGD